MVRSLSITPTVDLAANSVEDVAVGTVRISWLIPPSNDVHVRSSTLISSRSPELNSCSSVEWVFFFWIAINLSRPSMDLPFASD